MASTAEQDGREKMRFLLSLPLWATILGFFTSVSLLQITVHYHGRTQNTIVGVKSCQDKCLLLKWKAVAEACSGMPIFIRGREAKYQFLSRSEGDRPLLLLRLLNGTQ